MRGLKQVFHEKPFQKLFMGISWLASREMSREKFRELQVSRE